MPSSKSSQSLYGIRPPKSAASKKDVSSSTTLAFTSHLSSLIDKSRDSNRDQDTEQRRPRTRAGKEDIFATHNKNTQKRAAADLTADNDEQGKIFQRHKTASDVGVVDEATLRRSQARMAEKARLYAELKKGEYLAEDSDEEYPGQTGNGDKKNYEELTRERARLERVRRAEGYSLVDFDRKWAEEERKRLRGEKAGVDEEEQDEEGQEEEPLVEYTDEFGRTRRGTRSEAAAARAAAENHEDAASRAGFGLGVTPLEARPSMPSKIIRGATVQAGAFNPDENTARQMAELAAKREKSLTPPPETHYDAEGEVRTRGTGFYAFSRDEERRRGENKEPTIGGTRHTLPRDQEMNRTWC
ncbi:hypothetical protein KEM55_007948 [Ascosphaera atra]|nr:hypothetical protein KEM55_007948 [Ascosphaera atra]